jgi:hypothetical protein
MSALGVVGYLTFSKRFGPVEPPEPQPPEATPARTATEFGA